MRCRQCGLEVDNDKAFCPVCGAPMKVTADYDYIQAEIANKVDRYFNEDNAEGDKEKDNNASDINDIDVSDDIHGKMAKTRDVYGSDSIFDDDPEDDEPEEEEEYDPYEDYDDEPEEDEEPVRAARGSLHDRRMYDRPSGRNTRHSSAGGSMRRKKKKNQTLAKVITVLIIIVIIAAAAVGVMGILGLFNRSGETGGTRQTVQNKATLTSNLAGGVTYKAPIQITLTNELEGNIFYTLDGSEPSINSKMYSGPFEVSGKDVPGSYPQVHLRAVSYNENSEKSGDLDITFELEYDEKDAPAAIPDVPEEKPAEPQVTEVSAPQITPDSGTFTEDTRIMVSAMEGADIYYTTDGSTPDSTSQRYTGPVDMLPGTHSFAAVCVYNGIQSEAVFREYTLDYGYPITPDAAVQNAAYWLANNGYTIDFDFNTWDGHIEPTVLGVKAIDEYSYYIVQLDFYDDAGNMDHTEYLGIGVNYGGGEHLVRDGDTYYYN